MTYRLQIEINGSHPTETIATLEDLVYFIDDLASIFSSQQFVDEEDIPLIITYQGEHNLDSVMARPLPSKLILLGAGSNIIAYEGLLPEFQIRELVRHIYTGQKYIIKAYAYYHISRAYTYLAYDPETDYSTLLNKGQLITEHLWKQMPTMLWNITELDWYWDETTNIFQCNQNVARKMRPIDVLASWKMHFNDKKVPF